MRKHFPLMTGLVISLLLGALVGQVTFAEEEADVTTMVQDVLDRHCKDVAEEMGEDCIGNTFSNDHRELKNLATNEIAPFYNLYLFTYQNISEAPKEAAIDYMAKIYPKYNRWELEDILVDGDLSKIWDKALSTEEIETELAELAELEAAMASNIEAAAASAAESGVTAEFLEFQAQAYYIDARRDIIENNDQIGTQTYLLEQYSKLTDAYSKELQFQTENRKLAYQAYSAEIFFDNNLSNSANIDILHDLDIMNFLMFGEFIIYPDREEEDVELASEDETQFFQSIVFEDVEEEVVLSEEIDESDESEIDPYVCLEDETLREALEDYENYVASDDDNDEEQDTSAPDTDEPDEDEEPEDEATSQAKEEFDDFVDSLTTTQGDWTRSLPCGEIFCITVNLVKGTWGTTSGSQGGDFEEEENCIACHLDFIAAATDETLSGGVQPNKVSQNWFEDGTCKDVGDGLNLDFHVYAIPVPIELDPSDDTDDLANKQQELLMKDVFEWSYLNQEEALGLTAAEFDQAAYLKSLDIAGTPKTTEETLSALADIESKKSADLAAILTETDIQVKVESSYYLYHQMAAEFQTMLLTFTNYSDWIKDSYAYEDAPLSTLLKKKYCTE
jgi:hypothetical protein